MRVNKYVTLCKDLDLCKEYALTHYFQIINCRYEKLNGIQKVKGKIKIMVSKQMLIYITHYSESFLQLG